MVPWEAWLPSKMPKSILGPYFLYACLAAWHFAMPWWVVLTVALWGTILTGMAILQEIEKNREGKRIVWRLLVDGYLLIRERLIRFIRSGQFE
jgi:hypothetical protein